MLKKKSPGARRIRDARFLEILGRHCRRLRVQKDISIDRLSKESDGLSSSVIHRLENGTGAVTVSAIYRYAAALAIHPRELLDFEVPDEQLGRASGTRIRVRALDDASARQEAFRTLLPLYTIRAAAGYFGSAQAAEPRGWVEAGKRPISQEMFVVQITGDSMLPRIQDGDFAVFKANPVGTKQGKIVLAQYRGPADPDTGGSYTVKKYSSSKMLGAQGGEWRHRQVTLSPLNPDFEPITLAPESEDDFKIIGEYLFTL